MLRAAIVAEAGARGVVNFSINHYFFCSIEPHKPPTVDCESDDDIVRCSCVDDAMDVCASGYELVSRFFLVSSCVTHMDIATLPFSKLLPFANTKLISKL